MLRKDANSGVVEKEPFVPLLKPLSSVLLIIKTYIIDNLIIMINISYIVTLVKIKLMFNFFIKVIIGILSSIVFKKTNIEFKRPIVNIFGLSVKMPEI